MNVEIRETIVTPDANGALVQLRISDGAQPDVVQAIQITLVARVPAYSLPLLAHHMASEILQTLHDINPKLRRD